MTSGSQSSSLCIPTLANLMLSYGNSAYLIVIFTPKLRNHATITVLSHVLSIIAYEFYYSTKIDDAFSKELKMLADSKKMEDWVEVIEDAPIQLAELQNSKVKNGMFSSARIMFRHLTMNEMHSCVFVKAGDASG